MCVKGGQAMKVGRGTPCPARSPGFGIWERQAAVVCDGGDPHSGHSSNGCGKMIQRPCEQTKPRAREQDHKGADAVE